MKLNKCNLVRKWLIDEERDLCVHATEDLKSIFVLMIYISILFILLIITSVFGYKVLKEYSNLQSVQEYTFLKKRYSNNVIIN